MLPADVARCSGVEGEQPDEWREGCADCQRRTDRSTFPLKAWIAPPVLAVFECEARIPPSERYTVPAHNLRNLPPRISFEAARAEALAGEHAATVRASAEAVHPAMRGGVDTYSTQRGEA